MSKTSKKKKLKKAKQLQAIQKPKDLVIQRQKVKAVVAKQKKTVAQAVVKRKNKMLSFFQKTGCHFMTACFI